MLSLQDLCGKTVQVEGRAVTGQPINKKLNCFDLPKVSPGNQPLAKEPGDSGRDWARAKRKTKQTNKQKNAKTYRGIWGSAVWAHMNAFLSGHDTGTPTFFTISLTRERKL